MDNEIFEERIIEILARRFPDADPMEREELVQEILIAAERANGYCE